MIEIRIPCVVGRTPGALRLGQVDQRLTNRVNSRGIGGSTVRGDVKRRGSRGVRRGHARAAHRRITAVEISRGNVQPGRRQVDRRSGRRHWIAGHHAAAVVGKTRQPIVAAANSVQISQRADRHDFGISGGNRIIRRVLQAVRAINVPAVIARGDHKNDPLGHAVADRRAQRGAVTDAAETQVGHLDLSGVLRDEINPLNHRPGGARPGVVHHLDRPQPRPRRNADDTDVVVDGRRDPGDVRAMTVPVGALPGNETDIGEDIQIRMRRDARVQNRNVRVDPFVHAVDFCHRREMAADEFDARGDDLCGGKQLQFRLDRLDARVLAERFQLFCGNLGGKSMQRVTENVASLDAVFGRDVGWLMAVLEDNDVPAGNRIRLGFFSGGVDDRCGHERQDRPEQGRC